MQQSRHRGLQKSQPKKAGPYSQKSSAYSLKQFCLKCTSLCNKFKSSFCLLLSKFQRRCPVILSKFTGQIKNAHLIKRQRNVFIIFNSPANNCLPANVHRLGKILFVWCI